MGEMIYKIYKAVTYTLSPFINFHIRFRKFRGLEHPLRWPERLGRPSLPRPPGRLIWFHAVSLGEGMCVVPVIKRCVERRPDVTVLMTTTTTSAFEVLKNLLPSEVIYQFAPVDTPAAVNSFLGYWKPYALVLVESELWPNLVLGASANGYASVNKCTNVNKIIQQLVKTSSSVTYCADAVQIFIDTPVGNSFSAAASPPSIINFCGDLKLGTEELFNISKIMRNMEDIQEKIANRCVWMASSIHKGEEEVMLGVHRALTQKHPNILAIFVARHPNIGQEIAHDLQEKGVNVALRSRGDSLTSETSIYMVDTLGELRQFYSLTPIAVIGGSFLSGLTGHNISEAAAAGCAVLTGQHVGHFSHMVMAMQRLNPLSIMQVGGGMELEEILDELLSKPEVLEARRLAAKQAFHALSSGVIENVWTLLQHHIIRKAQAN